MYQGRPQLSSCRSPAIAWKGLGYSLAIMLDEFPIEDVRGIGRASAVKPNSMSIYTAGHLRDMPPRQARQYGTVIAERTILELRGICCIPPSKFVLIIHSNNTIILVINQKADYLP